MSGVLAIHPLARRKLQLDLSRLELERAQSKLAHLERLRVSSPQAQGEVRVEYIDDLDVLVIRGDKENVAKITDVIKQLQTKKKVDDKSGIK